jgi:hypothetical protein
MGPPFARCGPNNAAGPPRLVLPRVLHGCLSCMTGGTGQRAGAPGLYPRPAFRRSRIACIRRRPPLPGLPPVRPVRLLPGSLRPRSRPIREAGPKSRPIRETGPNPH